MSTATTVDRLAALSGSVRALTVTGALGSALIAAGSYWVGAIPLWFRERNVPIISDLGGSTAFPRALFYLGTAMLVLAWLQLGRLTLDDTDGTDWRVLRRIAVWWTVPLLLAMPIASRDLWAYAAQGQLLHHHLNPYTLGPSALPNDFTREVSHRWIGSPAPYGPLWLLLGKGFAAVMGTHVTLTVMLTRLFAVGGLCLIALTIPGLCDRVGGRASVAMWLVVLNPLQVVLGVGGGHNDLLMLGMVSVGLWLVASGGSWSRLAASTLVITLAVAIKSPAVVALGFSVPIWLAQRPERAERSPRRVALAVAVTALISVAAFTLVTLASGLGLGWVKQVNASVSVVTWMSLPTAAAMVWQLISGHVGVAASVTSVTRDFRTVGTVLTLGLLSTLWLTSVRSVAGIGDRLRGKLDDLAVRLRLQPATAPWQLLAIALFAVVVLGPAVQSWYFGWGLAILALLPLRRRLMSPLAGICIALVVMIRPNGTSVQLNPVVIPILICSVLLARAVIDGRGLPGIRSRDPRRDDVSVGGP